MSLAKRYKKRGVYLWFIDIPAKLAGKRFLRRAKGQVRALAEQEAQKILARLVAGKHPYDDEPVGPAITMGEAGKYTLLYRPRLKPSTARRHADLDRQFILPEFRDVPLDKIDVPAILRAHANLKVRGVVARGRSRTSVGCSMRSRVRRAPRGADVPEGPERAGREAPRVPVG